VSTFVRRWLPPVLLLALVILLWEAWVLVRHTPPYVLPSPGRVAGATPETLSLLPGHVATTMVEALAGLVLGAGVGVLLAAVLATYGVIRRVLYPLLVVSQTVPIIVLAPLLVLGFGYGLAPKIVVVALIAFFPVVVATVDGLDGADPEIVELVRSMGADRRRVFRTVRVPAAIPSFFSGLRIAAAYAVGSAVIGEYVGASSGIGVFIEISKRSYLIDRIFVAVVVTSLLSVALFALVTLAGRLATPWLHPTRSPNGTP
jgi:ABC-type nitrate/sulfonate/bicarbonate transport system permease component